jgi:hypothetical protein
VCKRWEDLFFSEPALWRRFLLRPAKRRFTGHDASLRPDPWGNWCAARHRQLARVAGMVEAFEAGPRAMDYGCVAQCAHASGWRLGQFVSPLRPEVLTEALLYWGTRELSGLLCFPRLTRLLLHGSEHLRLLGRMPQLRSLGLHVHEVSGESMSIILGLTQLTQLSFVVFNALTAGFNYQPLEDSEPRAPDLLQLTCLAQLRHLTITHRTSVYVDEREEHEFDRQGVLPLPAPASFPHLEFYHVGFRQDDWYTWAFSVSEWGSGWLGWAGGCEYLVQYFVCCQLGPWLLPAGSICALSVVDRSLLLPCCRRPHSLCNDNLRCPHACSAHASAGGRRTGGKLQVRG